MNHVPAVAGCGPHKRYHKKKALAVHGELPILIPILDDMAGEGVVALSDVNVIKCTHRDATSAGIEAAE